MINKGISLYTALQKRMSEPDGEPCLKTSLFARSLGALLLLFFFWNLLAAAVTRVSPDQIISASRLLVEGALVLYILMWKKEASLFVMKTILVISSISSLVVLLQILEEANVLSTPFRWVMTDFWGLYNEGSRKTGLLSHYQISSFLAFISVLLMIDRKDWHSACVAIANSFAIVFGARTMFLAFPFLLLLGKRALLGTVGVFALLFVLGTPDLKALLTYHAKERLLPAASVVLSGSSQKDYSAKDTFSQYKAPTSPSSLWVGNGISRYEPGGGYDPVASRWLLQAGIPAMVLVLMISGLLIFRIALMEGLKNKVFAGCLLLLMVKQEMVTSTLGFPILLFYIYAGGTIRQVSKR